MNKEIKKRSTLSFKDKVEQAELRLSGLCITCGIKEPYGNSYECIHCMTPAEFRRIFDGS